MAVDVSRLTWNWPEASLQQAGSSSLENIINAIEDDKECTLQIVFMPPISTEATADDSNRSLKSHPAIRDSLNKTFGMDHQFLTHRAWDANGFFSARRTKDISGNLTFSASSRFLTKYISTYETNESTGERQAKYKWRFLSFHQHWSQKNKKTRCIVLCFDDASDKAFQDKIRDVFDSYDKNSFSLTPYAVQDALMQPIIEAFDQDLWTFRTPVRDFEKDRERFIKRVSTEDFIDRKTVFNSFSSVFKLALKPKQTSQPELEGGNVGDTNYNNTGSIELEEITKAYLNKGIEEMHEISRHVIHICEVLEVGASTVKSIMKSSLTWQSVGVDDEIAKHNTEDGLRYSSIYAGNLRMRAGAFKERMQNEIQLRLHVINLKQLSTSRSLLQETADSGKELVIVVTIMTLLFLPGTFIASIFGMNFFSFDIDKSPRLVTSSDVWMYPASLLPTTMLGLVAWISYRNYALMRKSRSVGN